MLEIFIYTKHIFNQSPYDEVANLAKKNLLLQFSDYRSAIFHFVARLDEKSGVFTKYVELGGRLSAEGMDGWGDANITYTSAIAPPGDYRQIPHLLTRLAQALKIFVYVSQPILFLSLGDEPKIFRC